MNDLISDQQVNKVKEELDADIVSLTCHDIFEDDPSLQFAGAGMTRCSFITSPQHDEIVKIARSKAGKEENKTAYEISNIDNRLIDKTFAKVTRLRGDGEAIIQKEVEPIQDTDMNTGSLGRTFREKEEKLHDNLRQLQDEEDIVCRDLEDQNLGLNSNNNLVLMDMGDCKIDEDGEMLI